jgi:uncharacterized Zn finger protein
MNNIKCSQCNIEFVPAKEQQDFIIQSTSKGMNLIMLECPKCGKLFPINPILSGEVTIPESKPLRCPVPRCVGLVSKIDDDNTSFYGCGECGSIWYDKKNLYAEILNIIEIYPYRDSEYIMKGEAILPSLEIKDYEIQVLKEKEEKRQGFVRG